MCLVLRAGAGVQCGHGRGHGVQANPALSPARESQAGRMRAPMTWNSEGNPHLLTLSWRLVCASGEQSGVLCAGS